MGRCLQWREQYTKQPSSILEKNIASKSNQKTEFMVGKKIINIRVHPYKVGNIKNRTISNVEGEIFKS